MPTRRETLLDAATRVLGERGMRALTHRAVDAEAGLAVGSTVNYFPTRDALLVAVTDRVSELERHHFDELAATAFPSSPAELGRALAGWAREATGVHRALTLSRYAILVEAGTSPGLAPRLAPTGLRVNAWLANWLRLFGSGDPDHDVHVLGNYVTGLVLHQLAIPDPAFDPTDHVVAVVESLLGAARAPVRGVSRHD